jgi:hypothetical protein
MTEAADLADDIAAMFEDFDAGTQAVGEEELVDMPEFAVFDEARDDIALAGADGERAAHLLEASVQAGLDLLHTLTEKATRRLLEDPDPLDNTVLFDDDELKQIADSIAATKAAADLLGRSRVHGLAAHFEKQTAAKPEPVKFAEGYTAFQCRKCGGVAYDGDPARKVKYLASTYCPTCHERAPQSALQPAKVETFADSFDPPPDPFSSFAVPPPPLRPTEAIDYFRNLVPTLSVRPDRFGPLLGRQSFTMAVATDEYILNKVKSVIAEQIAAGTRLDPVGDIRDILDGAGVTPSNPQYAEMVYRTNMQDSYIQGQQAEYSSPTMQDHFPAWEYHAIVDERARPHHAEKNGNLYPSSIPFTEVRGTDAADVINCRCGFSPIHKLELARRLEAGERVQEVDG